MQHRHPAQRLQHGFSVVLVLMLLVLLSGLLAYGATLTSTLHSSLAQDIAIGRSEQAARTGLQWGRWQVIGPAAPKCPGSTNPTTFVLPLGAPQTVTVRCQLIGTYTQGGTPVSRYLISATACNPPGAAGCRNPSPGSDYVERTLTGWAER